METMQSKTLKALKRFGKEASIKKISKLINSTYDKTRYYLRELFKKNLVLRRIEYKRNFGITMRTSYYRINDKNKKNVDYWIRHY